MDTDKAGKSAEYADLIRRLTEAWARDDALTDEQLKVRSFIRSTEEWLQYLGVPIPKRTQKYVPATRSAIPVPRPELPGLTPTPAAAAKPVTLPHDPTPKGAISVRKAVGEVLRAAGGRKMHAQEIYDEVLKMGGKSEAGDPVAIIDLHAYNLKKKGAPIERDGSRTWKWVG